MLDMLGMERGVLVQPAIYGDDNEALVEALSDRRLAGVGSVGAGTDIRALQALRDSGMRGLRFVEARDPRGGRYRGTVGLETLIALAPAMREVGLHAELWAPAELLVGEAARLSRLDLPIVLDHLGGIDAAGGAESVVFRSLVAMVVDLGWWVKLTVPRASRQWPHYSDARPFHAALVGAAPSRVVWGSDWPHVRMGARTPVTASLLDLFELWVEGDSVLREQILVSNPTHLYQFDPLAEA